MNTFKSLTVAGLATLLASGCVIDARERDTLLEPIRTVDIAVPAGAPISIRIPAAEVQITNSRDDRLTGELRVMCPDRDGHCAEKLHDLEFVDRSNAEETRIALTYDSMWRYRNGNVEIELRVPAGHRLDLDISAGSIDVDVSNCLRADIEAGEASFTLPIETVNSVELDAGIGDAALTIDGRHVSGHRSLLVGAEAHWSGGDGDCDVYVDLQTGDLRMDLTSSTPRRNPRVADRRAP